MYILYVTKCLDMEKIKKKKGKTNDKNTDRVHGNFKQVIH